MTRRVVLGLILAALVLAAAVAPWTVSSERLVAGIGRQMASYGLQLSAAGPVSVALLPVPRVKMRKVTLADAQGAVIVGSAQLRAEIDIRALLAGRIALDDISLSGGRLALEVDRDRENAGSETLARLKGETVADGASLPRRLTLSGMEVDLHDVRTGYRASLSGLELFVLRPLKGTLAASATATWRGQAIAATLESGNVARLLAGEPEAFVLRLTSRLASLSLDGRASGGNGFGFSGQVAAEIGSIGQALRWVSPEPVAATLDRRLALSGAATLHGRDIAWPKVRLDVGDDVLEGTLSGRLAGDAPALRATLAAARLDLGWLLPTVAPMLRGWADGSARPGLPPNAIADLRLSASDAVLGGVHLSDGAVAVMVEGGRADLSLLRAGFAGGTVKGRVSAALDPRRGDLKGQITLDRVDAATALAELSLPAALSGTVQGQALVEAPAGDDPDVVNRLGGRATLAIQDGGFSGFDGAEMLKRAGANPSGPIEWRPGPTAFARAALRMNIADGVGEIAEGSIEGNAMNASLQGRVSIPARWISVRAATLPLVDGPGGERASVILGLEGPWSAPQPVGFLRQSEATGTLGRPAPPHAAAPAR